jgi:hypothetical protein
MLAGIFFALFGALDERAQKNAQEILSQISDDPQISSEEAQIFRALAESVDDEYGPCKRMLVPLDIVDQVIADLWWLGKLKGATPASEEIVEGSPSQANNAISKPSDSQTKH